MKKRLLFLLFLLPLRTIAQGNLNVDSLIKLLDTTKIKEQALSASLNLFYAFRPNKEKALFYLNHAEKYVYSVNTADAWVKYYRAKSKSISAYTTNVDSTCYYLEKAIEHASKLREPQKSLELFKCYDNMANVKMQYGYNEEALEWLLKAENMLTANFDHKSIANNIWGHCYNFLFIFKILKQYDNAEIYARKALQFSKENKLTGREMAISYSEIGSIYNIRQQNIDAIPYLDSALKILNSSPIKYKDEIAGTTSEMAACYTGLNKTDSAIKYYTNAYQIDFGRNSPFKLGAALHLINLYKTEGIKDSCFKYINYLSQNLHTDHSPTNTLYYFKRIAEAYAQFGKPDSASLYFSKYINLSDSTLAIQHEKSMNELVIKYEAIQKDKQIAEQNLVLNERKLINIELQKQIQLATLKADYELKRANAKTLEEKQKLQFEEEIKRQKIISDSELAKAAVIKSSIEKDKQIAEQKLSLSQQKNANISFAALAAFLFLVTFFLLGRYRNKQKTAVQFAEKNQKIETLIKELHHRVKNNMQVISSLLSLQSNTIMDDKAKEVLQEGQHRVEAIGLIHQKLFLNDTITQVNIKEYIETLIKQLITSYRGSTDIAIKLSMNIEAVMLHIDTAIPLGLIINELATNALKYGLDGNSPELNISLKAHKNDQLQLFLKDNGKGFDKGPDMQQQTSIGLKLVATLTRQIKGTLHCRKDNGTIFIIDIPQNLHHDKG